MSYSDPNRLIHYEGNVDIRQGTGSHYEWRRRRLSRERNQRDGENSRAAKRRADTAEPKGIGDWVQYTTANEVAVLKGNPARVEDVEKGSTEGARLTLYVREDKVTADDPRGPQSPGRVRSTHKVKT